MQVHSDSATGAESDSALSERKERKGRARRRKTWERLPRLTVLEVRAGMSVDCVNGAVLSFLRHVSDVSGSLWQVMASDNGPVVSCLLETNQSRAITFKFDLHEADADAISYKMVSGGVFVFRRQRNVDFQRSFAILVVSYWTGLC